MRCLISGGNVAALARGVQALSRVGDECYLETSAEGLALRTVNSSRSAFASFLFAPLFFQTYEETGTGRRTCKVVMKSMMSVFRSSASADKSVEFCKLVLDTTTDRLLVQILCLHGIKKTHKLAVMECESLQAVFSRESCPNKFCAQPKLLTDTVSHFPTSQEEVTMEVDDRRVIVRNFREPESESRGTMLTELVLAAEEFEGFTVNGGSEVTYCLKELRGFLMFAELSSLPISIHFSQAGSPVIFSIRETVLDIVLLLATLANDAGRSPRPQRDFKEESYLEFLESGCPCDGEELISRMDPRQPQSPSLSPAHRYPTHGEPLGQGEVEEVPGTPPQKKFRSLFFGAKISPHFASPTREEILASDSDSDGEM